MQSKNKIFFLLSLNDVGNKDVRILTLDSETHFGSMTETKVTDALLRSLFCRLSASLFVLEEREPFLMLKDKDNIQHKFPSQNKGIK